MFTQIGLPLNEAQAAMRQLFQLRNSNREALQEIFAAEGASIRGILAYATDEVSEVASQLAPWLTGTLSSAHRSKLQEHNSQLAGVVYISRHVQNPVFGGYPADYGVTVHQNQPWFEWTVLAVQEEVLDHIHTGVQIKIQEIYNG